MNQTQNNKTVDRKRYCKVCDVELTPETQYSKNVTNLMCRTHLNEHRRKSYASLSEEEKQRVSEKYKVKWHKHKEKWLANSADRRKKYDKSERAKEAKRRNAKKMHEKYRDKHIARMAVNNMINTGKLKRQPCQVCGDLKSQAHHEDYSKPLDVMWLCVYHHRIQEGKWVRPR